jgi:hypothetical protein
LPQEQASIDMMDAAMHPAGERRKAPDLILLAGMIFPFAILTIK